MTDWTRRALAAANAAKYQGKTWAIDAVDENGGVTLRPLGNPYGQDTVVVPARRLQAINFAGDFISPAEWFRLH